MRDDVPAALPLLTFVAALAFAPHVVSPGLACAGLALITILLAGVRLFRPAVIAGVVALGLLIGAREHSTRADDRRAVRSLDRERFVVIDAPIEGDWSQRPHLFVLRLSRFRMDSTDIQAPLTLYARFAPPPIGMHQRVRAEGHLRTDRQGGYTLSVKSARLLRYEGRLSTLHPAGWNRMIANRLRRHAAERPDEIAMIEALLLGRGERLSEQTREDFKRGGTYHLLVFSGLQISLAAGLIALLLRWAGAAAIADWSLLVFAALAPAFIGPEASVSRASMAIGLYAFSRVARRPTTFENLWCVAAMARLAVVPSDLAEPAFHLTYAGAGALLFVGRPLAKSRLRWFAYAAAAEIAIAPLTLLHFHQYALGGSVATIVMTPVVLVMLLTGACFSMIEWVPVLDAIAFLNGVCTVVNTAAAPLSGMFAAPPTIFVVIGFGAAVAAIAQLRGGARTVVVILSLALPSASAFVSFRIDSRVSSPSLIALDVGQGDALLVRSGAKALLVDGGGRHEDLRFGENVVVPLLLDRGVGTLDAVVLTHAHPDHCGGLPGVVRHLTVRELWISPRRFRGDCARTLLEAAVERATPIRLLRGGETLDLGGAAAEAIVADRRFRRAPDNNHSVVVALRLGPRSALLTGDIERDAERALAGRVSRTDVLKIPHHGSRSSTSPELLDAVSPRVAIISCGLRNFFGHPHPVVLDELRRRRIRVLRTDLQGTIEIRVSGSVLSVRSEIDTPR